MPFLFITYPAASSSIGQDTPIFTALVGKYTSVVISTSMDFASSLSNWPSKAETLSSSPAIAAVLEDAMEENPFLTVIYEDSDEEEAYDA